MGRQDIERTRVADSGKIWDINESDATTDLLPKAPREPHEAAEDICQGTDAEGPACA